MGIFNKVGSGKWVMTGSPGFPLCAKDVPSVVAHLWGLQELSGLQLTRSRRRSSRPEIRAQFFAPHRFDSRPVLVEGGHLHVDEAERQDRRANDVVGDI